MPKKIKCILCRKSKTELICEAGDIRFGITKKKYRIIKCRLCGLVFTEILHDKNNAKYYPEYRKGIKFGDSRTSVVRDKLNFIENHIASKGKLLDIGSGYGDFIKYASKRGWQVTGVEPFSKAKGKTTKGIRIIQDDFVQTEIKTKHDVITFWHSLEHFQDPLKALEKTKRIISSQGLLVISVPNIDSLEAKIFGPDFIALDIPRHRYHYSLGTLREMLARSGFKIISVKFWDKDHNPANFLYSLASKLLLIRPLSKESLEKNSNKKNAAQNFRIKIKKRVLDMAIIIITPFLYILGCLKLGSTITIAARPVKELKKANISIGIPSFNEEKDIAQVISAIQGQITYPGINISEIFVVDGNSTDNTRSVVKKMMRKEKRIKLIAQKERSGKIDAINVFIAKAEEEILVMANSDNIPDIHCLQRILNPLANKKVGLTGPRMICLNNGNGFFPFINQLIWRLHHQISLKDPKMSSFIAFRKKQVIKIPREAIIDEPAIEAIIKNKGLKIVYVPEARAYLKGAENLADFIRQRRRNHIGYLNIEKIFPNYSPPTYKMKNLLELLIGEISFNIVDNFYLVLSIILETYCKAGALYDYHFRKKNYNAWPIIKTSKGLKIK